MNRKEALQAFLAGTSGSNPYVERGTQNQLRDKENQGKLDQIQATHKADLDSQDAAIKKAQTLREYLNKGSPGHRYNVNVSKEGATISEADQALKPGFSLTPAQEAAERDAGKKIADFEGGGKQSGEANVGQIQGVQQELQQGKRDSYDKYVGGALENHPALMAFLAPSEKSRRDRVQNAMLGMLHDAGIPRPTQWDIQRVFGQVYDPASDDQTNITRLTQAASKIGAHQQAQQAQADQYHKTGYATIGAGQPKAAPAPTAPPTAPGQPPAFDPDAYLKGGK